MLDFSFGEIGLVAVVALLALGPERLPKVARTVGVLVRRARATWQSVRDDVEAEFAAGDLTRGAEVAKQIAADVRREIETSTVSPGPFASDIAGAARVPAASHLFAGNKPVQPTGIGTSRPQSARQ